MLQEFKGQATNDMDRVEFRSEGTYQLLPPHQSHSFRKRQKRELIAQEQAQQEQRQGQQQLSKIPQDAEIIEID